MTAMRYWYLHHQKPVHVIAQQTSDVQWYLPELNLNVDGADLFRTPIGVLKALRRRISAEIERRDKLRAPHPDAIPTKVKYLWVINGESDTNIGSDKCQKKIK